jgi:hypothetical protein
MPRTKARPITQVVGLDTLDLLYLKMFTFVQMDTNMNNN